MKKFLLIDTNHLFNRSKYVVHGTIEERVGLCLQIILNSIAKVSRMNKFDHIVFAFDGRSWRKDFYPPYKANRAVSKAAKSDKEQADDNALYAAFDKFKGFIENHTNCTVLYNENLEADDTLAAFVQLHKKNAHLTIVSSDKDFVQLLSENVIQYDGLADQTITINGVFDKMNKAVLDKKTKLPKIINPEWSLFEKCVRGCSSDNVFSAYPGVRTKGSKNKPGLEEAFADRNKKGFNYNNLMLQEWSDHNKITHKVIDDFKRNTTLCDLTAQPDNIKSILNDTVSKAIIPKNNTQIGTYFLKFCGQFDLVKVSENANIFAQLFSASYPMED